MLWPQMFDSGSNKELVICQAVTLWKNQIVLPVGHHLSHRTMMFSQLLILFSVRSLPGM